MGDDMLQEGAAHGWVRKLRRVSNQELVGGGDEGGGAWIVGGGQHRMAGQVDLKGFIKTSQGMALQDGQNLFHFGHCAGQCAGGEGQPRQAGARFRRAMVMA